MRRNAQQYPNQQLWGSQTWGGPWAEQNNNPNLFGQWNAPFNYWNAPYSNVPFNYMMSPFNHPSAPFINHAFYNHLPFLNAQLPPWEQQRLWLEQQQRVEQGFDPGYVGKAPKGYKRDDDRIKEDICDLLIATGFDWSEIEVLVREGEVSITGTVPSRVMKLLVEQICDHVPGVRDISNLLKVKRPEWVRSSEMMVGDEITPQSRSNGEHEKRRTPQPARA